jgi:type II secretory pathway pseudopilin PulG
MPIDPEPESMTRTARSPGGFTLVEAVVAIGVVAILAGIFIPLVAKHLQDARMARARNDIHVIVAAIAAQMADTGRRPNSVNGPGGSHGTFTTRWHSRGEAPRIGAAAAMALVGANNTFVNLFTAPDPQHGLTLDQANTLFGFPPGQPHREMGYKGPYLTRDIASRSDPWGNFYFILGYNEFGQRSQGPIWVVSAGPAGTVNQANLNPRADGSWNRAWDFTGLSRTNIALRAN